MKRRYLTFAILLAVALIGAGCGSDSNKSTNACIKNPLLPVCGGASPTTGSITGRILVPNNLALSRDAGAAADRSAALDATKVLPGATVALYTMGSDGALTVVAGVAAAVTDTNGVYTISGVPAGTNYIIQATLIAGLNTINVRGVVTMGSASLGTTVSAGDSTTETTFAVQGLKTVVTTYNASRSGADLKPLSAFSTSDVASMVSIINSNLQTQVTAGNVSLTDVHISASVLATQFGNLRTNVSSLNTLVNAMDGALSDTTPPSSPAFVNDGLTGDVDTTTSTTQLSANWAASTDLESGISAYWYSIGTTAGASNTVSWTSAGANTSVTKTGLSLTSGSTYYFTVKAQNGAGLFSTPASSDGILVQGGDVTPPTVLSFSPASGATNVPANNPTFKVIFSETMMNTVDLNNQAILNTSGFSITMNRQDTGGVITIDSTNALAYGTFEWMTTTVTSDTLAFTLKSNATLVAAGLHILYPGKMYNITGRTVPTILQDAAGNQLTTTGIASTGQFMVATDTTPPTVLSFSPENGATNVANDSPVFRVVFSETMNMAIDLNNQATLTASGFSITLENMSTLNSFTIDTSNAKSYGTFVWMTTTTTGDTLGFILKSNATLTGLGLRTIKANTTYNITGRNIPSNLTDYSGNALNTAGVASTGSFRTLP